MQQDQHGGQRRQRAAGVAAAVVQAQHDEVEQYKSRRVGQETVLVREIGHGEKQQHHRRRQQPARWRTFIARQRAAGGKERGSERVQGGQQQKQQPSVLHFPQLKPRVQRTGQRAVGEHKPQQPAQARARNQRQRQRQRRPQGEELPGVRAGLVNLPNQRKQAASGEHGGEV